MQVGDQARALAGSVGRPKLNPPYRVVGGEVQSRSRVDERCGAAKQFRALSRFDGPRGRSVRPEELVAGVVGGAEIELVAERSQVVGAGSIKVPEILHQRRGSPAGLEQLNPGRAAVGRHKVEGSIDVGQLVGNAQRGGALVIRQDHRACAGSVGAPQNAQCGGDVSNEVDVVPGPGELGRGRAS